MSETNDLAGRIVKLKRDVSVSGYGWAFPAGTEMIVWQKDAAGRFYLGELNARHEPYPAGHPLSGTPRYIRRYIPSARRRDFDVLPKEHPSTFIISAEHLERERQGE